MASNLVPINHNLNLNSKRETIKVSTTPNEWLKNCHSEIEGVITQSTKGKRKFSQFDPNFVSN